MPASNGTNQHLRLIVTIAVAAVWAISFLAAIFVPDYQPDPLVHGFMTVLVGTLFGVNMFKRDRDGADRE